METGKTRKRVTTATATATTTLTLTDILTPYTNI
jgi:hypothetical protein